MNYVYMFKEYKENDICNKLGKKGTYLSEIASLGLPVPNGFVITTDACNQYYKDNRKINHDILEQINEYITQLEQSTGKMFGDIDNPLLISVKCSPKGEIPNIMNTILNVGLTEKIVENLSKKSNEFIWIWECYLNFIKDYAKNIMGIDLECYEYVKNILNNSILQLPIKELRILSNKLKEEYKLKTKTEFPDNSLEQLYSIINVAFKSWNNQRANIYRTDLDIPFTDGMAICIQSMVFGNINKNCKIGIGTIFTRDPITGEQFFIDESSEQSLESSINMYHDSTIENSALFHEFPKIYNQLKNLSKLLEYYYKDMLKIDFVIENNKLFITQVLKGKRTATAALKIACDFADEEKTNELNKQNSILMKIKKVDKK